MTDGHPRPTWIASMLLGALLATGCATSPEKDLDWFDGGDMKPASAETLQLTARVLASKGETARAEFVLDRLQRDYPNFLGTYTEAAEILLANGRVKNAIARLDQGLRQFPGNGILLNNRGMCHLLDGRLADATRDFEAAYAADPADADYVGNLALARALAGNETEAVALWGRIVSGSDVDRNLEIARKSRSKFANASAPK